MSVAVDGGDGELVPGVVGGGEGEGVVGVWWVGGVVGAVDGGVVADVVEVFAPCGGQECGGDVVAGGVVGHEPVMGLGMWVQMSLVGLWVRRMAVVALRGQWGAVMVLRRGVGLGRRVWVVVATVSHQVVVGWCGWVRVRASTSWWMATL